MGSTNTSWHVNVQVTSTLTWSVQVESVCQRARRQIGIIYRKFYGHSNRSTLLQLYLAYVRRHLEYAVPVWDPHQQGHINSLEKVQKFALKVCTGKWNMDYDSLLNFCKLPTLFSRRNYLKLSFLYQIIHGSFTFPNAPLERRFIPSNLRSTASSFLLQRPRTHTNAYQYSFFSTCYSTLEQFTSLLTQLELFAVF